MHYEQYFPKGLAKGPAFCNRQKERAQLKKYISLGQHTLLMSPRRYGKTSLVRYVVDDLGLPNGQADLFVAVDADRIGQILLSSIKDIVHQVCGTLEKSVSLLTAAFKNVNSEWIIGVKGLQIVLTPDRNADPAQSIQQALKALEELLKKKQQKAILFIDEIQEIAEVAEGKGIEGAIRHVAQESKQLVFIFSGSKRHMLSKMFFDKSRPLYKLCEKILLDKIAAEEYKLHLNALAHKKWQQSLAGDVLEKIFEVTHLHPYYLNSLCLKLWTSSVHKPSIKIIHELWIEIIQQERLEVMRELDYLSIGQRKILIAIAEGYNKALTSKAFLRHINLSSSSVIGILQVLEQKDYVQKNEHQEYSLIDPLCASTLLYFYEDHKNG